MRTGGVGAHYIEVSNAQAGNRRLEKDLNRTLRAGSEGLAAVIFLRKVDPRCDDLFYGDIRFCRIAQCDGLSGTLKSTAASPKSTFVAEICSPAGGVWARVAVQNARIPMIERDPTLAGLSNCAPERRPRSENRSAQAHAGCALFDGDFEIVRHAHGKCPPS